MNEFHCYNKTYVLQIKDDVAGKSWAPLRDHLEEKTRFSSAHHRRKTSITSARCNPMLLMLSAIFCLLLPTILPPCAVRAGTGLDRPIEVVNSSLEAPYFFLDASNNPQGLTVDLWRLWSRTTGRKVEFSFRPDKNFPQVSSLETTVFCGLSSDLSLSSDRFPTYLLRSVPAYIFYPADRVGTADLAGFSGSKVGLLKGDYSERYPVSDSGTIPVVFNDYEELLHALETGIVAAVVADGLGMHYHLTLRGRLPLSVIHSVKPLYSRNLFVMAAPGRSDLMAEVVSGFQRIDSRKISVYVDKWSMVRHESSGFRRWATLCGGIVVAGLLSVLLWNSLLRRKVTESTRALEEKNTSLKQARSEMEAILSSMTSMVMEVNLDGIITRVVPTGYEYKMRESQDIVGNHVKTYLTRLTVDEIGDMLHRVISGRHQEDFQYLARLERNRWLNLCLTPLREDAVLVVITDITDRRLLEQEKQRHAFHDALTGLPNRALFIERLKHAMERYRRRRDKAYSVLFVDVDRFKMINDSLGHNVGDRLLKSIADVLSNRFRKVDTVARFGSDEFVVLLDEIEDDRTPIKVAERIMVELKKPVVIEGHEIFASVSIGIAYGGSEYQEPSAILRDADTAMHQAKTEEKGGYRVFHSQMHSRVRALLKMETDLRRALDREEFRVHYQPIIDMRDGRTTALEALIRWQHPEKGQVSPIEFIPMAEETGLIVPIGEWVLKQACLETRKILDSYTNGRGQLSLNLSARQFMDAGLVETILGAIRHNGMEPGRIKLEITETTIMQNGRQASRIIEELKNYGLSIAIDDFGTGYSSLSYLQQFPFDTLKIDRSFIKKLQEGQDRDINIINIILSLARALSMDVVAEGIETVFQRDILMNLGCHIGQGFLYAKPMNIIQLEMYLTENSMALN